MSKEILLYCYPGSTLYVTSSGSSARPLPFHTLPSPTLLSPTLLFPPLFSLPSLLRGAPSPTEKYYISRAFEGFNYSVAVGPGLRPLEAPSVDCRSTNDGDVSAFQRSSYAKLLRDQFSAK